MDYADWDFVLHLSIAALVALWLGRSPILRRPPQGRWAADLPSNLPQERRGSSIGYPEARHGLAPRPSR